jgi:hypothetical protein
MLSMPNQGTSRFRLIAHRFATLLFASVLALQSGCGTVPLAPKTQHQDMLGKVALVAVLQEPEIKFEGFARGKGEGAATGAGTTFLSCVGAFGQGGCSGAFCGAVAILWLGACGVAGAVGGVVGAAAAPGAAEVRAAETTLSTAMDARIIQESLRDQVVAAAVARNTNLVSVSPESARPDAQLRDYRSLAATGVETVLEVAVTKVGTEGMGINAPLLLRMRANVRLIRAGDNAEIFTADYDYVGKRLKLSEWSADQAEPLLRALEAGYVALGSHIFDNVFLLYAFPDREAHLAGWLAPAFGLAPIYPATRGTLTGDPILGNYFEWTTVDTLRPTLRWQGFPRETDITAAPADMGRVKDVRYDLIVAREQNLAPAQVVYRREGLPDTMHTIEISLSPAARYFWVVRARFKLDGRERLTEWSSTNFAVRERLTAPSQWSYRFKTPQ